jgi:hypothetical protein
VESRWLLVGKVGECDVESWYLQGYSPHLCRLMTDGLAPASKYWIYWLHTRDMWPVSLVVGYQYKLDFLHCFIVYCEREARYGSTDQSTVVLWIGTGTLLLRGSESVQICWWLRERLPWDDRVRYVWSMAIRWPSMGGVCHVDQVFPCRVYINSNHRDSQIWVTACLWSSTHRELNAMSGDL